MIPDHELDSFNKRFPVGKQVMLRRDDGSTTPTAIKHLASRLVTGMIIAWVEGSAGCWSAERIEDV